MQAVQQSSETIDVSREKLLSLVGRMFGGAGSGREDDEHPLPPGPWDPVIRKAAAKIFGPSPEPWRFVFGPFPEPWRAETSASRMILGILAAAHPEIYDALDDRFQKAGLNPQPLPPRAAFLVAVTEEVIERALLLQEIADAMNQSGEERGIIVVGGKLAQYVDGIDELCPRLTVKIPKPKGGSAERFSSIELLAAGAVFEQNAAAVADEGLRNELRNAGARLIEMGAARL